MRMGEATRRRSGRPRAVSTAHGRGRLRADETRNRANDLTCARIGRYSVQCASMTSKMDVYASKVVSIVLFTGCVHCAKSCTNLCNAVRIVSTVDSRYLAISTSKGDSVMSNTVLVTGVSSGIGKATAHLFASKGWNVVATLREPEQASELGQIDNVLVARLDVQDAQSIQQAVEAGIARFGSIDVLVNNAGFGQYGLLEALSREDIQRQFDVNVFGVMDVTRALLPHFRKNGHGAVVNISSGAGIFTLPLISLYCATKFALEGFSEA